MHTLSIRHSLTPDGSHLVAVDYNPGNRATGFSQPVPFTFELTESDRSRLRFYMEEVLTYPDAETRDMARRIEADMERWGEEMFRQLFLADPKAHERYVRASGSLSDLRVEIQAEHPSAWGIPWEIMRDPNLGWLAVQAQSFVRLHANPRRDFDASGVSAEDDAAVRILYVVCRPDRDTDVPFQAIGRPLLQAFREHRERVQIDVLRPPTFEALGRVLRDAMDQGQPYHVLHFDGHGVFTDLPPEHFEGRVDPRFFRHDAGTVRGYLSFEDPTMPHNCRLVTGDELGELLVRTQTSLVVLNACQSATARLETPQADPDATASSSKPPAGQVSDQHGQDRAYGSLAHEIMAHGVGGVVAMQWSVYVQTAAAFVGGLYERIANGMSLGEAVGAARADLRNNARRESMLGLVEFQDWPVPVAYEAASIGLFARQVHAQLSIRVKASQATPGRGDQVDLPRPPDHGFYGRDETLLALDRAFDTNRIVLLQGYAGSGKTTAAAEFARWYGLTGGVEGPVLFTSFERYLPLPRVLDQIERVFGPALEQAGVHWLALNDDARRDVALQVLGQIPILWLWDNVEPVAGFPRGTRSEWSETKQADLRDFLRDLQHTTRAKVLLTSRRDEADWLGNLPVRITVPPMPMAERVQLTRALAERQGRRLNEVDDWRLLLRFTQGNPLTITILVGQVLRDGLQTRDQIDAFVARLRAGEAAFADEEREGRAKSLGASLRYGFEHAFSDTERRQLALLHLFQGFVHVNVLGDMGVPDEDWSLPELRGLTREAGMALLDRAAEVGLLTAYAGGYYTIHPALPWYFVRQFQDAYPGRERDAMRAFVEAMGALGDYYYDQYGEGNREVINVLSVEEANLLHARHLAHTYGWWRRVISTMTGLHILYDHTGRRAEWKRLVEEIVPDFVDPETDGPLPGREENWSLVTQYRVLLAEEARVWEEAERLQGLQVEWTQGRSVPALALPADRLDSRQRSTIQSLAVSVAQLGQIQREQGDAACVASYKEAIEFAQRIGDQPNEAAIAHNLGHAYKDIAAIRDLAQAEQWYQHSLKLYAENDRLGRGQCLVALGNVACERFRDARMANRPEAELLQHLNAALRFYHQALDLFPSNAVDNLAVVHNQLGNTYCEAGGLDQALTHYRESIRYKESAGNVYAAAQTRHNVAVVVARAGHFHDALTYANAALRNFQTFGGRAAEDIERTQQLIAQIEQNMNAQGD